RRPEEQRAHHRGSVEGHGRRARQGARAADEEHRDARGGDAQERAGARGAHEIQGAKAMKQNLFTMRTTEVPESDIPKNYSSEYEWNHSQRGSGEHPTLRQLISPNGNLVDVPCFDRGEQGCWETHCPEPYKPELWTRAKVRAHGLYDVGGNPLADQGFRIPT